MTNEQDGLVIHLPYLTLPYLTLIAFFGREDLEKGRTIRAIIP